MTDFLATVRQRPEVREGRARCGNVCDYDAALVRATLQLAAKLAEESRNTIGGPGSARNFLLDLASEVQP